MGMITIVGLGPGAVGHLSLETMSIMQSCKQVILRTAVHPTVTELAKQGVSYSSCDDYTKQEPPLKRFIKMWSREYWRLRLRGTLCMRCPVVLWLPKRPSCS